MMTLKLFNEMKQVEKTTRQGNEMRLSKSQSQTGIYNLPHNHYHTWISLHSLILW